VIYTPVDGALFPIEEVPTPSPGVSPGASPSG
jgi:hypothetical protein